MTPLSEADRAALLPALDGWVLDAERDALTKRFTFGSFGEAFGWMTRVALAAERMNHHPEWRHAYRIVEVALTTHAAGGLTRRDVELAQQMDRFASG